MLPAVLSTAQAAYLLDPTNSRLLCYLVISDLSFRPRWMTCIACTRRAPNRTLCQWIFLCFLNAHPFASLCRWLNAPVIMYERYFGTFWLACPSQNGKVWGHTAPCMSTSGRLYYVLLCASWCILALQVFVSRSTTATFRHSKKERRLLANA